MKIISSILIVLCFGSFIFNTSGKCAKSTINKSDTLKVPYTYWWPSGGPFTGLCGDKYAIVFTGTITKLYKPSKPYTVSNDSVTILYSPQKGVIKINEIKVKKAPDEGYKKVPGTSYYGESYFSSDCFYDSRLNEGDKVLVFIYSYEGEYSIPSGSILKIDNFDDPMIKSIEIYIKSNQDPLTIRKDTSLWEKYGQGDALKQIIDCRLSDINKN